MNLCLYAQSTVQQGMLASLFILAQTKFNKSFRQVFTSHLPFRWPQFGTLIRTLPTGHSYPVTVTIPGGFKHTATLPPPISIMPLPRTHPPNSSSGVGGLKTFTQKVAVQTLCQSPTYKSRQVSPSAMPWKLQTRQPGRRIHPDTTSAHSVLSITLKVCTI